MPAGGCEGAWCLMMNQCLIQGVFMPHVTGVSFDEYMNKCGELQRPRCCTIFVNEEIVWQLVLFVLTSKEGEGL